MADDKKLPPNMLAEFADGSGAGDARTREKEKERAEDTRKDNARGPKSKIEEELKVQLDEKVAETSDKKKRSKCSMALVEDHQGLVRGLGDASHPEDFLKRADHPGTADLSLHDEDYLSRPDEGYLDVADRF